MSINKLEYCVGATTFLELVYLQCLKIQILKKN